jgi:hypothetical protein
MVNFVSMLLSAAEGGMKGESREKRELPRNCKGNESRKDSDELRVTGDE